MHSNLRPSQVAAVVGQVSPASQTVGTALTGWIDASQFECFLGILQSGVLGASGTLDAKFRQATDNIGTNAKDVAATIIPQNVVATDNNKINLINLLQRDLDFANGFRYFALSATVGGASSLISGVVIGMNERFGPATMQNAGAIVKQVVN